MRRVSYNVRGVFLPDNISFCRPDPRRSVKVFECFKCRLGRLSRTESLVFFVFAFLLLVLRFPGDPLRALLLEAERRSSTKHIYVISSNSGSNRNRARLRHPESEKWCQAMVFGKMVLAALGEVTDLCLL